MAKKLKIRESDLVVQDLNNEVLIYDLKQNKAFCLNQTSSLVWRLCTGENTVTEISRKMSQKLNSPIPEDLVWLALEQFKKDDLLDDGSAFTYNFSGLSRRDVVKKIGLASVVALPVISSIIAPLAVNAQSGCLADGLDFCLAAQPDINACIDAIFPLETTACCTGTFQVVTFDNPLGSNSCCGTCGPRIG